MVFSLTWLPDVLQRVNLKTAEVPEWRGRGREEMGRVRGVIIHHTVGAPTGNMPSLNLLVKGRSDLRGPLAQLGLGRDGTFYIIAAGRANHAGDGEWRGIRTGNSSFIGIEVENTGAPNDTYPDVQITALRLGVAAILKHIRADATMVCGHKEYAPARKIDPLWPVAPFREAVAALLARGVPPLAPVPASDDQARPTIRREARGPVVVALQTLLGIAPATGYFGPVTEAKVRAWQRTRDLVPDGIVGPKSWAVFDNAMPGTGPGVAAAIPPVAAGAVPAATAAVPDIPAALPIADDLNHPVTANDRNAMAPDGQPFAARVKLGFRSVGTTAVDTYIARTPGAGAGISPSVLRALAAVMQNEGKLEAVNSYDNAFLSFGIMQWTAGSGDGEGELAPLLARLKRSDPATFQACFGRYGLDTTAQPDRMYGRMVRDGRELKAANDKAFLRSADWAYRFWRAGHHPSVREAQVAHAGGRIARFADNPVHGHPLRSWCSSELAMALLLDQHVNRPGHVPGTLETALGRLLAAGNVPADPVQWHDADEKRLIDRYIIDRAATSMTHSDKRASALFQLAKAGKLATSRHSFA